MSETEIQERLDLLFGEAPTFYNRPNTCHKTQAGVEVWESRSVAVVLTIAFYDPKQVDYYIPMGKRGDAVPDGHGLWSLPCGYIDYNENGAEAAMRETREEIGLHIERILYQQHLRGKRVFTSLFQPWHVDHFANTGRQNVSLHFAVAVEWDMDEELPELTNKYNEKVGEVDEFEYFSFYEYLLGQPDDQFAFGHNKIVERFIKEEICDFDAGLSDYEKFDKFTKQQRRVLQNI